MCAGGQRCAVTTIAPARSEYGDVVATVSANRPLDAAPIRGRTIYFTTDGPDGPASSVPAGGGKVARLRGAPLSPRRACGLQGRPAAVRRRSRAGSILVCRSTAHVRPLGSAAPPRGLEIQSQRIVSPARPRRKPAVLALGAAGAKRPTVLAKGGLLRSPQAVAIARGGTIYVSDDGARDGRGGGTARVVLVNTMTLATSTFNDVIGENMGRRPAPRARDRS